MKKISHILDTNIKLLGFYFSSLIKWLTIALITGIACGIIGSIFHIGVHEASLLRAAHPWLLWLLPVGGLGIIGLYKLTKTEGQGTNDIIDAVSQGKVLSILLVPAIFLGTVITHLCGGSAGREGAALQMGGTIGHQTAKLFHLDDKDKRVATMIGMAAFFSALFGTPLTATLFSMTVISVGVTYHAAFVPCFAASMTAYGVSLLMGVEPTAFDVIAPDVELVLFLKVAGLAALCALVSVLFCHVMHAAEKYMAKWFPNSYIRVMVGGALIIALTYLFGTSDYNGAGMDVVARAIEEGKAAPFAFLFKLILTAITLAAGFKGGEVVPSFFVGATFGCVVGPLLGISPEFAAAIGLVAVFCGAVNCPVASIFLSIELFGAGGILYFALACGISFMLSGYSGLYSSQTILYSKLKAQYINVHTNKFATGQQVEVHKTK